ncbi:unnamed protein product [Polarella glacialis]|uniref:Uncharacterized protein n=1 Tax=Polarella glacialis TaxID=89957 RepID=A0A813II72_POLGL|nr:unnamed protein product [Polarella glacialis]CAE8703073.1 unnamed protein product [Polarella glacialis]
MSAMPLANAASSSPLGTSIEVSGVSFVRFDNPLRVEAYTQPGASLTVMHRIAGNGGCFMVPEGNLLCGLIQWVVKEDGSVIPEYWIEHGELEELTAQQEQKVGARPEDSDRGGRPTFVESP